MNESPGASRSRVVVLLSTLLLAMLSPGCAYLLYRGPAPDSVFFIHRSPLIFHATVAAGVVLFASIAVIGVKRLKTM